MRAATALGSISKSDETIDALITMLNGRSEHDRSLAALALRKTGDHAGRVRMALGEALSEGQSNVRIFIAGALILAGGNPEVSLKVLSDALRSSAEPEINKFWALEQIVDIGPVAKPLIPDLINLLKTEEWKEPVLVAQALGRIGEGAMSAVPDLVKMLNEASKHGHIQVALALWRITQYPESVTILQKAFQDRSGLLGSDAAQALVEIGPDAIAAVPALRVALHEGDFRVRHAIRSTLPKITGTPFTDDTAKN